MISMYFELQRNHTKKNLTAINFVATMNRKRSYMSTGLKVDPKHFDKTKQKIKSKDDKHAYKNQLLYAIMTRAQNIVLDYYTKNKPITLSNLIDALKNKTTYDLKEFCELIHKEKSPLLKKQTIKNYTHQLNKLADFKNKINLYDIDLGFINNYKIWLKTERKNDDSTISKSLAYLRMILLEAEKKDLIDKSPFRNFKIKAIRTRDESLNQKDLNKLEDAFDNSGKYNLTNFELLTLKAFLFSCYTGIAFSDCQNLKRSDVKSIEIGDKAEYYISNERIKTNTSYIAPLTQKSRRFINLDSIPKAPLLRMFHNQSTNRHLKRIFNKINTKHKLEPIQIDKVSFHLARHTFGSMSLNSEIDQKLIMSAMGHKSVKVNDIYSRVDIEFLLKKYSEIE